MEGLGGKDEKADGRAKRRIHEDLEGPVGRGALKVGLIKPISRGE